MQLPVRQSFLLCLFTDLRASLTNFPWSAAGASKCLTLVNAAIFKIKRDLSWRRLCHCLRAAGSMISSLSHYLSLWTWAIELDNRFSVLMHVVVCFCAEFLSSNVQTYHTPPFKLTSTEADTTACLSICEPSAVYFRGARSTNTEQNVTSTNAGQGYQVDCMYDNVDKREIWAISTKFTRCLRSLGVNCLTQVMIVVQG